jgi:hypothetical protein
MDTSIPSSGVRVKTVAIPPEHGAWGFLFEPVVLGLGVAPSLPGLFLSIGVIGAFLARYPAKIALTDRMHHKRYARTRLAERFALGYSAAAGLGVGLAVAWGGFGILLPLLLAVPLAALLFLSNLQNRARDLLPELAGACALALTAASLALAGGKSSGVALALWIILLARNIPSILYVRARLRLERGKPYRLSPVLGANVAGIIVVLILVLTGVAPVLALAAVIILLIRAIYGLSPYRRRVSTQSVGFQEVGFGLMTVLFTILGYAL